MMVLISTLYVTVFESYNRFNKHQKFIFPVQIIMLLCKTFKGYWHEAETFPENTLTLFDNQHLKNMQLCQVFADPVM